MSRSCVTRTQRGGGGEPPSAPSWLATIPGEVYTLHFWPPYGNPEVQAAGHYTGWTQEGKLRVPPDRSRARDAAPG